MVDCLRCKGATLTAASLLLGCATSRQVSGPVLTAPSSQSAQSLTPRRGTTAPSMRLPVRGEPATTAIRSAAPFAAAGQSGRVPWQAVGRSVQGRPIVAVQLGRGAQRVLVIGSVHGDEGEGVALAERLAAYLLANPSELAGRTVLIVRDANPDGYAADSRTNANGVDLNRNFPARNWNRQSKGGKATSGSHPASEPETRTLLAILNAFRPWRIVALHSTRGEPMVNYDGPAEPLARAMSRHNGYEVTAYIGYPTPGSLGSYAGVDRRLPIITLELPRGIAPAEAWRQNQRALVEVLRFSANLVALRGS